jgi:hypothetical protein
MPPKIIWVLLEESIDSYIDGLTLDEITEYFKTLHTKYSKYSHLKLERCHCKYDEGYNLVLLGEREECKEEQKNRLRKEKFERAQTLRWEKEQYKRLKKKFEGT